MSRIPHKPRTGVNRRAQSAIEQDWSMVGDVLPAAAAALGIAASLWSVLALSAITKRDHLLDVHYVQVSGCVRTVPGRIEEVAGVRAGESMLDIDGPSAIARLKSLHWVKDAHVVRHWPGEVRVEIVEHVPAALLSLGGVLFVVDKWGTPIKRLSAQDNLDLPLVVAIQLTDDEAGRRRVAAAIAIVEQSERVMGQGSVSQVALAEGGPIIHLSNGVEVILGTVDDLTLKLKNVQIALAEGKQRLWDIVSVKVDGIKHPEHVIVQLRANRHLVSAPTLALTKR